MAQFLKAIGRELSDLGQPHEVDTLFFGGGTPTHLPPDSLQEFIATAKHWFPLSNDSEFSIEANPLDITEERLAILKDAGVTRISLGVQSFHDRWLEFLERDHRLSDIGKAIERTRGCVSVLSLDLIFGLPNQTLEDWNRDLVQAIAFAPQHLSVYGLTFERGTRFWSRLQHGEMTRCPEESERDMYEMAIEMLTAAGFEHYEVSNFAQPGFRCRHNEAYWTGRTYFAAGPGAARHVNGRREVNHRSTTTYLARVLSGQSPVAESELLSAEDAARERFVFGLRRLEGINESEFARETGFVIEALFAEPLSRFIASGHLEQNAGVIRLTRSGLMVSDAIWPELLSA